MKTIEINGHLRESLGTKNAKQLRREGQVPCVVYGGEKNTHFYADERELNKLIYTPNVYQVLLDIDGTKVNAVMRNPEFHPVKDNLLHLDFIEVLSGKPTTMRIPLTLTGASIGVKNGGVLRHNAKKLLVRGVIENIPDEIAIDITDMKIGTSKKVGEIDIKDLEVLESSNRVVVAIKTSRKAIVEEEVEGEEGAEGEEATAEGDDAAAEAPAEA
ncbi:MAG: 50S ribosomal protein L25/general stress protein Ctc [Flavobacteriales bacterium]|nr:50S ribosomal protein L25/general stress protein Ctc [Flavobacteriales bacterium]